ncbi:hypothetical protein JSY36_10340 [Bacillus sp. H-16]|uniref:hypothetical protein n=1 Tax=Alteribacter salitolerans TaxID=2912333 RepID=UPI001962D249|nr:hypothetical protein [Alteribacter salitolerans]MBM7096156.1 hypothetical protein [Alteribacter salitolerans]
MERAKEYTIEGVVIPPFREHTAIASYEGLNSPHQNKTVALGYFEGDEPARLAFIWEVTTNEARIITDIRVVYDGANPFMNEQKGRERFEKKVKMRVLVPSAFPYPITHVETEYEGETLTIEYGNHELLQSITVKITHGTEIMKTGEEVELTDGTKACIETGGLRFVKNKMIYTIEFKGKTREAELIRVANSMVNH